MQRDFHTAFAEDSMPGMDGLSVLRHLRDQEGAPPVLVLSTHSEEQYAKRVKSLGASGYLTKSKTPKELQSAIRDVIHERRQRPSML